MTAIAAAAMYRKPAAIQPARRPPGRWKLRDHTPWFQPGGRRRMSRWAERWRRRRRSGRWFQHSGGRDASSARGHAAAGSRDAHAGSASSMPRSNAGTDP